MRNLVFSTERYDEEAQKHGKSKPLDNFRIKASVEDYKHPREMEYTKFPGNYIKIKHGNFRSVLTYKQFNVEGQDVCLYVALRMYSRGDSEYDKFKLSSKSEYERDTMTGKILIDWEFYEKKASELLKEPAMTSEKPEMTNSESIFISTSLNINHELFDTTIFETKEWINCVSNNFTGSTNSEGEFTDFTNAADEIYNCLIDKLYNPEGWYNIEFKRYAILAYKREDGNWILAKLVDRDQQSDYSTKYPQNIPTDFQRGYPCTFLEDRDEWRVMEQDSKSNMVLSSQQVDLVSQKQIKYPLFLTGRAGSGKSTLLQYLFAEIILRYINSCDKEETELKTPVYLSYSSNLIDDAKKLCTTLFEKNNVYKKALEEKNVNYKKDIQPLLPKMFYVFKTLLCDCIEQKCPGAVRKKFPDSKYISFPKFNSMWEKRFGKIRNAARDYGPSISWHVIRTYIKGWDSDAFLTPEDYEKIGDKNQSVTAASFKTIYDNVWKKWYSTLNTQEGIWDDQDLVIYCLQEGCVDDRFSAVFCDESQDFTRVEIDFILNSSSFAQRAIKNLDDINKLPFVFAGDEFQTLNPTGFSWESLRSYFTEKLCAMAGIKPQKGMIPDPKVLSENFRSTHNVVKLANRIQLLRASRFDEYSVPQKPHFSQEGNSVYCISPSDENTLKKLKENGVVLIVPANDGESVEQFINGSSLKNFIKFENGVPSDITILNPTQAKGLEYPNVAIFGFNTKNSPDMQIDALIKWFGKQESSDLTKDIELKYQISNAYVAVTRASSNLYIIDDVNRASFWAFAFNQSENEDLDKDINNLQSLMLSNLSSAKRSQWTENEIGWIEYVKDIDISDENLKFLSSNEHKKDLENRAAELRDAKLMLQAATSYKSAGNKVDEARCRANAASYDEKFNEAAEWFVKAGMYDDAVDNYWQELNINSKPSVVESIKKLTGKSHKQKIDFCIKTTAPTLRDLKVGLDSIAKFLNDNPKEQDCYKAWNYIITLMMQNLKSKGTEGIKEFPFIITALNNIAEFGLELSACRLKLATLAYNIGAYKEAITMWESMEKVDKTPEYCKAKLKIEKYPKNIEFYEGTKDSEWFKVLLDEERKNPDVVLNESQKIVLCRAIRQAPDCEKEFKSFLPFMLRSADSIENTNKVVAEAKAFGININEDVVHAIAELRYSDLQVWTRPRTEYVDAEAGLLFDAIEAIRHIRMRDFRDELQRKKHNEIKDFCGRNYNDFVREKVALLVYPELGMAFEQSGIFVNACIFYEWATGNTDEKTLKRLMDERWIVCKERQARNDNNDKYRNEAERKREQLGIGDKVFPTEPKLTNDYWEQIYQIATSISSEIRTIQQKETFVDENAKTEEGFVNVKHENSKNETMSISQKAEEQNVSLATQKIIFANYAISYFPKNKDVLIKTTDDYEYTVRIKCGVFPNGSDYELHEGRIYISENDTPTPFCIESKDNVLSIKIMDGNDYTGINFNFEV
jgi:hypothetical protein